MKEPLLTASTVGIRRPIALLSLTLWSLAAVALGLAGCSRGGTTADAAAARTPDAAYQVRGEIARLPTASSAEIWIRHESVAGFRDPEGKVVGMESMTMPFALASGESLAGLAVGDRIAFRLELRWNGGGPPATISGIARLPATTRLDFDPPPEPAVVPAEAAGDQADATPR